VRLSKLAALAAFATAAAATGTAFGEEQSAIPVGIRIPVVLTQTVTSQTAHVGDTFTFKTSKDEKLGDVEVPAGTPGHGRLAAVTPAQGKKRGNLSLQTDSLDLPNGHIVWVNIDTKKAPVGRLSKRHLVPVLLPVPFVGGIYQTTSGDLVLDSGIPFGVVTTLPRRAPAPLVTATPSPTPSLAPAPPAASPPTPAPPAASPPAPAAT
jgi:hypothetical protein